MEQRSEPPEQREAAREVPGSGRATMDWARLTVCSCGGENQHFLHQLLVGHSRQESRYSRIVQREEGEPTAAIQPIQACDLPAAELAFAVVDDDIGSGTFGGAGEHCGPEKASGDCLGESWIYPPAEALNNLPGHRGAVFLR